MGIAPGIAGACGDQHRFGVEVFAIEGLSGVVAVVGEPSFFPAEDFWVEFFPLPPGGQRSQCG